MNILRKWKRLLERHTPDVEKSQPGSSSVHVDSTEWETELKKAHDKENLKELRDSFDHFLDEEGVEKSVKKAFGAFDSEDDFEEAFNADIDSDWNTSPPLNNLDAEVSKSQLKGEAANPTTGSDELKPFNDMQKLVEGMDFEIDTNGNDPETAYATACDRLTKDPNFYRKVLLEAQSTDDDIAKGKKSNEGLHLDLGSGHGRSFGALGIDLHPYDHGTIVHDLDLGIPFPDGSAKKITMHNLDEVDSDHMLSEAHRVLKPGGELNYIGTEDLEGSHPGLELQEEGIEKGNKDGVYEQVFSKVRTDPATANDADPKIGIAQDQMLPTDQLLTMASLGSYDDGQTSQRANQALGYASQGALVDSKKKKVKKGGEGSGPHGSGKKVDEAAESYNQQVRAKMNAKKNVNKGGPGSGGGLTKPINIPQSPHISVGTRKGVLENMAAFDDVVPMNKITHVAQEKYVPKKLGHMLEDYDVIKDKPIDVLKVGDEYHVIDGHHRFLAAKMNDAKTIKARVRVKAENAVAKSMSVERKVPVLKAEKMKQIVYGVILAPNEVDFQDDYMTAEDIEEAAHNYLKDYRVIGSEHSKAVKAHPVESYIAPQDFDVDDGTYGPQKVTKGSWVMGVKITDAKEWNKVLDGDYTGFSVGGIGKREEI